MLPNTGNGSITDDINFGSSAPSGGSLTYNQGTFAGAATYLYQATGPPFYYQDAILVGKYTQNNTSSSAGIMPQYGSGSDLSGFNGIFARWVALFAKDQNLWSAFGPWLTTNANAAWSIRNASNLAWQEWFNNTANVAILAMGRLMMTGQAIPTYIRPHSIWDCWEYINPSRPSLLQNRPVPVHPRR